MWSPGATVKSSDIKQQGGHGMRTDRELLSVPQTLVAAFF